MNEKKIVVPDEMVEATAGDFPIRNLEDSLYRRAILRSALRWLSENPIVPSDEQVAEMKTKLVPVHPHWSNIVAEWQRRMFLAPEPTLEAIKDLLIDEHDEREGFYLPSVFNRQIREAYRRGKESR